MAAALNDKCVHDEVVAAAVAVVVEVAVTAAVAAIGTSAHASSFIICLEPAAEPPEATLQMICKNVVRPRGFFVVIFLSMLLLILQLR